MTATAATIASSVGQAGGSTSPLNDTSGNPQGYALVAFAGQKVTNTVVFTNGNVSATAATISQVGRTQKRSAGPLYSSLGSIEGNTIPASGSVVFTYFDIYSFAQPSSAGTGVLLTEAPGPQITNSLSSQAGIADGTAVWTAYAPGQYQPGGATVAANTAIAVPQAGNPAVVNIWFTFAGGTGASTIPAGLTAGAAGAGTPAVHVQENSSIDWYLCSAVPGTVGGNAQAIGNWAPNTAYVHSATAANCSVAANAGFALVCTTSGTSAIPASLNPVFLNLNDPTLAGPAQFPPPGNLSDVFFVITHTDGVVEVVQPTLEGAGGNNPGVLTVAVQPVISSTTAGF